MKETSKAMERRFKEHDSGGFPWRDLFQGQGLDVGAGDDPLTCALPFSLSDGGGDDIRDFFQPGTQFDFIHGSQVLEHMINPVVALYSWIDLTKEGGHIIATVPDFVRYEHARWPSRFNAGHRSTWSMDLTGHAGPGYCQDPPIHIKLPEWLHNFSAVEVLRCELIDTNYDYSLGPEVDQTLDFEKRVEAFIEFVLRKR